MSVSVYVILQNQIIFVFVYFDREKQISRFKPWLKDQCFIVFVDWLIILLWLAGARFSHWWRLHLFEIALVWIHVVIFHKFFDVDQVWGWCKTRSWLIQTANITVFPSYQIFNVFFSKPAVDNFVCFFAVYNVVRHVWKCFVSWNCFYFGLGV